MRRGASDATWRAIRPTSASGRVRPMQLALRPPPALAVVMLNPGLGDVILSKKAVRPGSHHVGGLRMGPRHASP
jgi:hypothetical protein